MVNVEKLGDGTWEMNEYTNIDGKLAVRLMNKKVSHITTLNCTQVENVNIKVSEYSYFWAGFWDFNWRGGFLPPWQKEVMFLVALVRLCACLQHY